MDTSRDAKEGRQEGTGLFDQAKEIISSMLMLLLLAIVTIGVVTRYFLPPEWAIVWGEEGATLMLAWICFLGFAALHITRRHMSVSLIVDLLPAGIRRWVLFVVWDLLPAGFIAIMLVSSLGYIRMNLDAYSSASGWPSYLWPLPYTIGCVLVLGYLMVKWVRALGGRIRRWR